MPEINYKNKYEQLKQKFMSSVDTAFRLGVEQGMQQAQVQQAQQAQADAQAAQEAAMNGGQPGQPGQDGAPGEEQPGQPGQEAAGNPASAHPDGSELDQHIAELEGLLGKSEYGTDQYEGLKKSLESVKSLRTGLKLKFDLVKGNAAIKVIAKNMAAGKAISGRPMNKQASHNLSSNAKASLDMQEKIVNEVMKSWSDEESHSANLIKNILAQEGASKKE